MKSKILSWLMREVNSNNSSLHAFTYHILYPAILGSMLYDVIRFENELIDWAKLAIVFFYVLDYFYLYEVFDSDTESKNLEGVLDLIISLLFGLAYTLMATSNHGLSLIFISALSIALLFYIWQHSERTFCLVLGFQILTILCLAAASLNFKYNLSGIPIAGPVLYYFIFLILSQRQKKKNRSTISVFHKITVYMNCKQSSPSSFIAEYNGYEVQVGIEHGRITGTMPDKVLKLIIEWYEKYKSELKENCELVRNGKPLKDIPPLAD